MTIRSKNGAFCLKPIRDNRLTKIITTVIMTTAYSIILCIIQFLFLRLHSDKSSPVRFDDMPI